MKLHPEVETGVGSQLTLDDTVPIAGSKYRNVHNGEIAAVIGVIQRRYKWVLIRRMGYVQEIRLDQFTKHHRPL